jgi:6-phosphogluconolactonase
MQIRTLIHRIKAGMAVRGLSIFAVILLSPALWAKDCFVYFGTFTDASSLGIYVSRLDMDSGKLSTPELAAAVDSPNYLAVSPDDRFLFAAARAGGKDPGSIVSFTIDGKTGRLRRLDVGSSGGDGPCYVSDDAADHCLLTANYAGGCVKSFHLNSDGTFTDGKVIQHYGSSVNPARQSGPHPHCFVPAPKGRFALACDLGLDKVMVYQVNPANAALTPNNPPFAAIAPGSGPRHIAFSPDGKTACVLSEMAFTVTVFDWDAKRGRLTQRQSLSLLPPGQYRGLAYTAAEIEYRPDGRFVYATIRGHNSVSVLAVKRRKLSLIQNLPCGGNFPRGMGIDPSGRWLIVGNQYSKTVTVFAIDKRAGTLTPTGQVLNAGISVDVKFAAVAE